MGSHSVEEHGIIKRILNFAFFLNKIQIIGGENGGRKPRDC